MSLSGALCAWVAVTLCASAAVAAQGVTASAGSGTTAARTAGDYSAFRFLLRSRNDACYLTPSDDQEQDAAAQRLYFGLYNPAYSSKDDPGARQFFPQMTQRQNTVLKAPGNYDLSAACEAVQKEVKAFHPLASTPTLKDVGAWCNTFKENACWCDAPNFDPPQAPCRTQSSAPAQSWVPNARWHSQARRSTLELDNLTVYTDFCYGRTMDAIVFLPKSTGGAGAPQNLPVCDASNVHIRQFVNTHCVGKQCGDSYSSTCGERNLDTWYLDECPGNDQHHLIPDGMAGGVHTISDEPTVNLPATGAALKKEFVDVVLCDDGKNRPQVLDALRWTRTGTGNQPQWCAVYPKDPQKPPLPRLRSATYGDLRRLDPRYDAGVRDAVCGARAKLTQEDPGLTAIRSNFGSCP